jgi:hypothetical protein
MLDFQNAVALNRGNLGYVSDMPLCGCVLARCGCFPSVAEKYAVVANSKAERWRVDVMQLLNVAEARIREALDGLPDPAGGASLERSQVIQGGLGPLNSLHLGR